MKMDILDNPIHDACRRGNFDFLKECLDNGVSPSGLDSSQNSPLHWSANYYTIIVGVIMCCGCFTGPQEVVILIVYKNFLELQRNNLEVPNSLLMLRYLWEIYLYIHR